MNKTTDSVQLDAPPLHSTAESKRKRLVLQIADVCFEMFSVKELRRPIVVLHELAIAFPDATRRDMQDAIQLAISWRLALKNAQGLEH